MERLQRLSRGALAVGTAGTSEFLGALFGDELASISNGMVNDAIGRLRGLKRFDRNQRLAAAHAVLVTACFFDAAAKLDLPFALSDAELGLADQASIISGDRAEANLAGLGSTLLASGLPVPTPDRPFEEVLFDLREHYQHAAISLAVVLQHLALWDRLDQTAQTRTLEALREQLPPLAVNTYEADYRRLATDVPEFQFWTGVVDHQATRNAVADVALGLARLEAAVATMSGGAPADQRRTGLADYYRRRLDESILSSGDAPEGIVIPTLGQAYVTPDFRVQAAVSSGVIASETTWERCPVRSGLEEFLVGQLTGPQATRAPLLVLGQPGSGKSVLTKVLAARLPASEFLVLRVVLREVPADAGILTQVEHAIRTTTREALSWADLVRSAGDALPVIVFDGFDELLQATGVSQSDFLERIAQFQREELAWQRPVAAIVTTRTAVADRARPTPDTVALRLEPFREAQVERWLSVWNGLNAAGLDRRGLKELTVEAAQRNQELASQPLLLLMLALYDADTNALQQVESGLARGDLYERLLTRFAEREVAKDGGHLAEDEFASAIEAELFRLSVVAFAMFNRGRQWVTERELDADLAALLLSPDPGAGGLAIGRFFFIHRGSAEQDGAALRTFEFLHATFNEYLLARLAAKELRALAELADANRRRPRPAELDDTFMHAVLSFHPLVMRGTAVQFLDESLQTWSPEERADLRGPLCALVKEALYARPTDAYAAYAPVRATAPRRHAVYSVNLVLVLAMLDGGVWAGEFFDVAADGWWEVATLWRSMLPPESWVGLMGHLRVGRSERNGQRDVHLTLGDGSHVLPPPLDLSWSLRKMVGDHPEGGGHAWRENTPEMISGYTHFITDRHRDAVAHVVDPILGLDPGLVVSFAGPSAGNLQSLAHALVNIWLSLDPAEARTSYEVLNVAAQSLSRRTAELITEVLDRDMSRWPTWAPPEDLLSMADRIRAGRSAPNDPEAS